MTGGWAARLRLGYAACIGPQKLSQLCRHASLLLMTLTVSAFEPHSLLCGQYSVGACGDGWVEGVEVTLACGQGGDGVTSQECTSTSFKLLT